MSLKELFHWAEKGLLWERGYHTPESYDAYNTELKALRRVKRIIASPKHAKLRQEWKEVTK